MKTSQLILMVCAISQLSFRSLSLSLHISTRQQQQITSAMGIKLWGLNPTKQRKREEEKKWIKFGHNWTETQVIPLRRNKNKKKQISFPFFAHTIRFLFSETVKDSIGCYRSEFACGKSSFPFFVLSFNVKVFHAGLFEQMNKKKNLGHFLWLQMR